jgi:hypothetical protein
MRERDDQVEGLFEVEEDLIMRGMVTGGAIVRSDVDWCFTE